LTKNGLPELEAELIAGSATGKIRYLKPVITIVNLTQSLSKFTSYQLIKVYIDV